jgi:hypothetical protein
VVAPALKSKRRRDRVFKACRVSLAFKGAIRTRGRVNMEDHPVAKQTILTTEDVLWTLGIGSMIISLSPVIAFYMLMVA